METRRRRKPDEREKEIVLEAKFYLQEGETFRSTAKHFALSKSQIQQDLDILPKIGRPDLKQQVDAKMAVNLNNRHHNGGVNRWKNYKKKEVQNG